MPPVAPPCPPMSSVELPCPVNNEMCIACMYMADLEIDKYFTIPWFEPKSIYESKTTKSRKKSC